MLQKGRITIMRLSGCTMLVIAFIFAGCMKVGPDFARPEVKLAQDWSEGGGRVSSERADYRQWWRVFDDPVLDLLIDRAYRENLTLRIAGVRVLEARAQLGIAFQGLFPQDVPVSGGVEYNRISGGAAIPTAAPSYLLSRLGVGAAWELDFWGRFRREVESAGAAWMASVADYDNALVSLTADVANSYILIRTLEKRLEIARLNAETRRESLAIAEARFRFGVVTELDVQQARTSLDENLASIPSLETQLRQARHSLSVLLGMAPSDLGELLDGSSTIPVTPPKIAAGIPADLLRRRPDIRAAEYRALAQSALIGVAKADLFPSFSLIGSIEFVSTDIGTSRLADMFRWSSRQVRAGPSFSWNILNFGRIINEVRVEDARLQALLIDYQNTVLTAQQEVEDNLVAFSKGRERAAMLARSTGSARNAVDIALLQYREGITDFTPVLTAQQALLDNQDNLAITLGDIAAALVGVYRALGGGWEIREGKDLVPSAITREMASRTYWGDLLAPASYNPPITEEAEEK